MKRGGPSLRSCPPRLRRTSGARDHVLIVTGVRDVELAVRRRRDARRRRDHHALVVDRQTAGGGRRGRAGA